jgi:hypothetical protein
VALQKARNLLKQQEIEEKAASRRKEGAENAAKLQQQYIDDHEARRLRDQSFEQEHAHRMKIQSDYSVSRAVEWCVKNASNPELFDLPLDKIQERAALSLRGSLLADGLEPAPLFPPEGPYNRLYGGDKVPPPSERKRTSEKKSDDTTMGD